jgi:outer membrane protein assembly factor BamB
MSRIPQGLAGLIIAALVGSVRCQPQFNDTPTEKWKSSVPPMGLGNGIVVSPDSQVVYATSEDGTVSAMDPDDGNVTWSYQPLGTQGNGTLPLSCNGEISISEDGEFFVYGVTEGAQGEAQTW